MAKKRSKEVRARMSAAAKKRWAKKRKQSVFDLPEPSIDGAKIGTTLRVRLPNDYQVEDRNPLLKTDGLISRMTQAIDKIETQIKRLESL